MKTVFGPVRRHLFLLLAGMSLLGNGFAADEDMFFSDLPIVASVSRLPQRLADAPTSVTVIDREMIRSLPIRDLNDIFRLVPGFQTYPNTTEAARVTYHGLTDEEFSPRLQVLLDGRSMYSSAFRNGVNWAILPVALDDIERIEIVRGTNAVSYGSNAFLGVINIITVDPSLVRNFSATTSYGSQNLRDYGIRAGGKLGEAGNFRFTYRQQNDDGLTNRYDWIDSFASRLFDLRADFALNERDSLQLSVGHISALTQRGRLQREALVVSNPGNPIRDFDQTNTYAQVLWRRVFSAGSELSVRYAYSEDWGTEAFTNPGKPSNTPPVAPYRYDPWGAAGSRHEIEAQHNLNASETTRIVWGGSWRTDLVSADTALENMGSVRRNVGRVFGNLEWKPAKWFTGNVGLAGEDDSMAGNNVSPRLSAAYHFNPQNTLRVGASRAYRTGSVVDYRGSYHNGAKYQFAGDPDMPSERMDTFEIGYLGDWRRQRMSLDVRLFNEKVYDRLLVIDRNNGNDLIPDAMTAIQDVRMRGVEYQWRWQPFDATRLVVNQSFLRADAEFTPSALANTVNSLYELSSIQTYAKRQSIDDLTERGAPRRATSILLLQKLPLGFEFSAAGYWQDKVKWSVNTWGEKYHRVDVRLGYPFHLGSSRGEVAYVVQSLNGGHPEYKAYDDPADRVVERRQWLSLRLDL
jgi:iron complex outermembrane recepter protein